MEVETYQTVVREKDGRYFIDIDKDKDIPFNHIQYFLYDDTSRCVILYAEPGITRTGYIAQIKLSAWESHEGNSVIPIELQLNYQGRNIGKIGITDGRYINHGETPRFLLETYCHEDTGEIVTAIKRNF